MTLPDDHPLRFDELLWQDTCTRVDHELRHGRAARLLAHARRNPHPCLNGLVADAAAELVTLLRVALTVADHVEQAATEYGELPAPARALLTRRRRDWQRGISLYQALADRLAELGTPALAHSHMRAEEGEPRAV